VINFPTRRRFTYPFRSHTRAETPSKDTSVHPLSLNTPRGSAAYAKSPIFVVLPGSRRTLNGSLVVLIGVERRGIGSDNGSIWCTDVGIFSQLHRSRKLADVRARMGHYAPVVWFR
jgi:hypothetical protein